MARLHVERHQSASRNRQHARRPKTDRPNLRQGTCAHRDRLSPDCCASQTASDRPVQDGGKYEDRPAYNPQGAKLPDSPEAIQHEIQLIQGSIDNEALPKNLHEAGKAHIEALQKEYDRLQGAQLKTSDELAKEGRAPGVEAAKTKARIGEETSPEAIAGASKKSAATSAAATSARENVENSDTVINKKIDAAVRTHKAKAEAAGTKPQTPAEQEKAKNALVTRAKNLSCALYTRAWKFSVAERERRIQGGTARSGFSVTIPKSR